MGSWYFWASTFFQGKSLWTLKPVQPQSPRERKEVDPRNKSRADNVLFLIVLASTVAASIFLTSSTVPVVIAAAIYLVTVIGLLYVSAWLIIRADDRRLREAGSHE